LHANLFRGICIKSTNQQAKGMRKQLIFFAQVIKFWKMSSSRGGFTPNPPLAYALGSPKVKLFLGWLRHWPPSLWEINLA